MKGLTNRKGGTRCCEEDFNLYFGAEFPGTELLKQVMSSLLSASPTYFVYRSTSTNIVMCNKLTTGATANYLSRLSVYYLQTSCRDDALSRTRSHGSCPGKIYEKHLSNNAARACLKVIANSPSFNR